MGGLNEGRDMSAYPSSKELRDWAMAKRPDMVQPRGNLPRFVVVAWDRAHPDRPYVRSQNFHGTEDGYRNRSCRCDGCVEAGRRGQNARYQIAAEESRDLAADKLLGRA